MVLHCGDLVLNLFELLRGLFLVVDGFLVALNERVRRRLEVALPVGIQLDGCEGTEVRADNLSHVRVILFEAVVSAVTGHCPNAARIDFDVRISQLNKGLSCNFRRQRFVHRSSYTRKATIVGKEVRAAFISHRSLHKSSLRS